MSRKAVLGGGAIQAQSGYAGLFEADWIAACAPWAIGGAGLVLLLVGGRLVRPALGLLGAALGALAGWVLGASASSAEAGGNLTWLVALAGGAAGGILGLCLFRPVVALGAALACGLASGVGAAAWFGALPKHDVVVASAGRVVPNGAIEERAGEILFGSLAGRSSTADGVREPIEAGVARLARDAWDELRSAAGAGWESTDARTRVRIVGVMVLGAAAGLVVGVLGPRRVVAVLSAAAGAGLLLSVAPLALSGAGIDATRGGPMAWLGLWALLSIIGAAAQLASLERRSSARLAPAGTPNA